MGHLSDVHRADNQGAVQHTTPQRPQEWGIGTSWVAWQGRVESGSRPISRPVEVGQSG
jgi:hypothetical protein